MVHRPAYPGSLPPTMVLRVQKGLVVPVSLRVLRVQKGLVVPVNHDP